MSKPSAAFTLSLEAFLVCHGASLSAADIALLRAFAIKAGELVPEMDAFQRPAFGTVNHSFSSIADFFFRSHGEYLGGMAQVIANVCLQESV